MAEEYAIISLKNLDAGYGAIKRRSGNSSPMTSADIATRVEAIPGPRPEQEVTITATENRAFDIIPDPGKVIRRARVIVSVPAISSGVEGEIRGPASTRLENVDTGRLLRLPVSLEEMESQGRSWSIYDDSGTNRSPVCEIRFFR